MKPHKPSQIKFRILLGIGALVALTLCIQCVLTYLYTVAVLVPQQAESEAERQSAALSTAARSGGVADPQALGPVIQHLLDTGSDRVLWMRVLNQDGKVLAQGGRPKGVAKIPARWWDSVQKHEPLAVPVSTSQGEVFVAMLPLRLRPPHQFDAAPHPPAGLPGRPPAYVLELAIPYKTVAGEFEQLRQNLFIGLIASVALLLSVAVIGLRAPHYFRGKYLESELQLARRVQNDLQPKPSAFSADLEFAAAAVAADHIGGDFYDIFEADQGKIVIVLGDVSGKGVSAALLVSVLQGAIRSSSVLEHEVACERINRMFCERTACERFATLFWGVFDPASATLRYVNAGHSAPFLIRHQPNDRTVRLDQGGPVLGLLPVGALHGRYCQAWGWRYAYHFFGRHQ